MNPIRTLALLAPSSLLVACGPHTITLEDAWSYHYSAEVAVEVVPVQDCPDDLQLDWSGLTTDLLGHDVAAGEVDNLWVLRVSGYTPQSFLEEVVAGTLPQSGLDPATYEVATDETSALITDFGFGSVPVDPPEHVSADQDSIYVLSAKTGAYNTRGVVFFEPTPGEMNTQVVLDSDSAVLTVEVDLGAGAPIQVPSRGDYLLEWLDLTVDGQGNPITLSNIDRLMLARYDQSVEELESQFFDLELIYDVAYHADIGGKADVMLSEAAADDGTPFASFGDAGTGEGTWLLALFCDTCDIPAPLFLGVVEPG
jgi:hypothetical protein